MGKAPDPAALAASLSGEIRRIRSVRLRLREERQAVVALAGDRDEAVAALNAALDRLAQDALREIHAAGLTETGEAKAPSFDLRTDGSVEVGLPFVVGLASAVMGDRLRDALIATKIDGPLRGRKRMARADKRAELDRLDAEILRAELSEEAAIRAAEDAGLSTLRRGDADPRAVLATAAVLKS